MDEETFYFRVSMRSCRGGDLEVKTGDSKCSPRELVMCGMLQVENTECAKGLRWNNLSMPEEERKKQFQDRVRQETRPEQRSQLHPKGKELAYHLVPSLGPAVLLPESYQERPCLLSGSVTEVLLHTT